MKRFLFNFFVAVCALFLSACQHSEKPETAFFRDFNLGATVEQMNIVQLQPKTGANDVSNAIGKTTERRRKFDLEYLLDERSSSPFNESLFLNELKSEISESINNAGVRGNGGGSSNDGFYFNYSTEENKGSIEIIGARVGGNKYKLWCVMRESAGIESK